jgi:hypothetical protein
MLVILRSVIHVINAILHLVAMAVITGGSILVSALVILSVVGAFLGLSSLGAFSLARRRRNK